MMAFKPCWIVEIFDFQKRKCSPKFGKKVGLFAEDHTLGVKLRFVNLEVQDTEEHKVLLQFVITPKSEYCRVGKETYVLEADNETLLVEFANAGEARDFSILLNVLKTGKHESAFSTRTDESSASLYFQFYSYLSQQQNMLQDFVRTHTYQRAMLSNVADFRDKVVVDVGAGSGILSFFAAQAGAKRVYAVEASGMATFAQKLVEANEMTDTIRVIMGKIEEIELPEKVDVIISEPMGYMLFNERMLETFLHAKKWLVPGGKMYPSHGDLHIAPFCDDALYMEQYNKANFWFQSYFHGVNLTGIQDCAVKEYFRQPIVDTFDIRICLSKSVRHQVDFLSVDEHDLHTIDIPLHFTIQQSASCHGLAFWFEVLFAGSEQKVWLSTSPTEPLTHWYQVRCLLEEPIMVLQGQILTGRVLLVANRGQSYDVNIELQVDGTLQRSCNTLDLKNPYFRYNGAVVQVPPGFASVSPSEAYANQVDAQGARNTLNNTQSSAQNFVNELCLNGFEDITMDTSQNLLNPQVVHENLIALVDPNAGMVEDCLPNIHPGCISSTGRARISPSSTPTHSTQIIGDVIAPSLFSSSNSQQQTGMMPNYPVSPSLMIADYLTPNSSVPLLPGYRQ